MPFVAHESYEEMNNQPVGAPIRYSLARLHELPLSAPIAVLIGAVLFMLPAVLNGFPFLDPDSSNYLTHEVRLWSSPFYGWFILPLHSNTLIWGPVIVQSLLLSHIVFVVTRVNVPRDLSESIFLGVAICLLSFSSLPFYVTLVMPDIFAGIMFLGLYLLAFRLSELNVAEKVYFIVLTSLAVAIHYSHIPIALPVVVFTALLLYWRHHSWPAIAFRVGVQLVPLLVAACAFFLVNFLVFRNPAVFPAGPNFLLANMIQYGPARHYLQEACPAAGYKICPYVAELPATANKFLWSKDFLLGRLDFVAVGDEASSIVFNTAKAHPGEVARMFIGNSIAALGRFAPATDLMYFERFDGTLTDALAPFGKSTQAQWRQSAQHRDKVPRGRLRKVQNLVIPFAALTLVIGCIEALRRREPELCVLPAFFGSAYLVNGIVCSFTSGIWDRYQARISWLLILASILLLVNLSIRWLRGSQPSTTTVPRLIR